MIEVLEPRRVMSGLSVADDSFAMQFAMQAPMSSGIAVIELDVLANDESDAGAMNISAVGSAAHGMVIVHHNPASDRPTLWFMPEFGFTGDQSFTYTESVRKPRPSPSQSRLRLQAVRDREPDRAAAGPEQRPERDHRPVRGQRRPIPRGRLRQGHPAVQWEVRPLPREVPVCPRELRPAHR